jgi:hypothetical protein
VVIKGNTLRSPRRHTIKFRGDNEASLGLPHLFTRFFLVLYKKTIEKARPKPISDTYTFGSLPSGAS